MKTPQLWWEVMDILKKCRTKRGITFTTLNQRLDRYLKQRKLKVKGVTPKIIKALNYSLNNGLLTLKVGHYALTSRGRKMNLDAESTDDDDSISTPSDSTYTSSTVTTHSHTVSDSTSRESSRGKNYPDDKPTTTKKKGKSSTKKNAKGDTKKDTKRDIKNKKGEDKNRKERDEKNNRNEGRTNSKSSENLPKDEKHSDDDEKCTNNKSCENNSDHDPDADCRATCNQGN